jgi:NAD(P)-dependent dehydrogenase (short-subunit alcohol dehydrogenase family)
MNLSEWALTDKVAIVTGAGRGIGRAIALGLAEAGANVVAASRTASEIEATAESICALGRRSSAVPTDVLDSRQVDNLVKRTLEEFERIDILVNNAGGGMAPIGKPIWEISDEEWSHGIDLELSSTFFCCRAVGKHMVERKQGKIINMASAFGIVGGKDYPVYCSAKAGVILLTMSLALAWAKENVRVNCLAPSLIMTEPPQSEEERKKLTAWGNRFPVGRLGTTDDIVALAVFLACDASDYLTGQVFGIDGGVLAGGYAPSGYIPASYKL